MLFESVFLPPEGGRQEGDIEPLSRGEGRNQLCAAEGKWKQIYLLTEA